MYLCDGVLVSRLVVYGEALSGWRDLSGECVYAKEILVNNLISRQLSHVMSCFTYDGCSLLLMSGTGFCILCSREKQDWLLLVHSAATKVSSRTYIYRTARPQLQFSL